MANLNHNMLLAQSYAFIYLHKMCPNAKIGPAPNICVCYPKSCNPEDFTAAKNAQSLLH
ncbi:Uncharacterised protein [Chlamydia trachomatis]|nr:Uncharacterised protein [Chlamydia trachomatis]